MMKKRLNIENWNRKDHFHFYRTFEEPFFGVTVSIDVTAAYEKAKNDNVSFFIYYMHKSLQAVNAIEAFRYRIENEEEVMIYDTVGASSTINREDGTFGFSYITYYADFQLFIEKTQLEIARVRAGKGLELVASNAAVIHYSTLPWLNFTSLSHARAFRFKDCIPKISFGQMTEKEGRKTMSMSVHVHHALMDGAQVGEMIRIFEQLMQ
jgi:chloramphenicol O-acetyltransferase type A